MILINKGFHHFYINNKLFGLNVLKYVNNNKFIVNYKIKKIILTCYSKGKGFCGVIKRWGFSTKDKSHGCSLSYRTLGSTGQCQDAGRVFPGKKMPGRKGNIKFSYFINIFIRKKNYFFIKKNIAGNVNDILLFKIL